MGSLRKRFQLKISGLLDPRTEEEAPTSSWREEAPEFGLAKNRRRRNEVQNYLSP